MTDSATLPVTFTDAGSGNGDSRQRGGPWLPRVLVAAGLCLGPVATGYGHPDFPTTGIIGLTAPVLPAAPLGKGAVRYQVKAGWAQLPEGDTFAPVQGGMATDHDGNVYVSSDGANGIAVFSQDGRFQRYISPELGGIRALRIHSEGREQFLYGVHPSQQRAVKLTLNGHVAAEFRPPEQPTGHPPTIDYRPTGIAADAEGRVFVLDGDGTGLIDVFDRQHQWRRALGAGAMGAGAFAGCNTLLLEPGGKRLIAASAAKGELLAIEIESGKTTLLAENLQRPSCLAATGDGFAVGELGGTVALLNHEGKVLARLGDANDQQAWQRLNIAAEFWRDGIFVLVHGVAAGPGANLYVYDWSFTGRVTKLVSTPPPP